MKQLERLWLEIKFLLKDEGFMKVIHLLENVVSKVLSLALIVVILVSVFDLIFLLVTDLLSKEPVGFFAKTITDIFGLFLNILITLELLENVTAYLRKHIVQVELVVGTALIAVARKIIIFDLSKYPVSDLIFFGIASLCLAVSYWLIRQVHSRESDDSNQSE